MVALRETTRGVDNKNALDEALTSICVNTQNRYCGSPVVLNFRMWLLY